MMDHVLIIQPFKVRTDNVHYSEFLLQYLHRSAMIPVTVLIPSRLYSFLSVVTLLARSHRLPWENLPAVVSRCLPPYTILLGSDRILIAADQETWVRNGR
jgi:hypothetical protein